MFLQAPIFMKVLGDDLRWNIVKALIDSDRKVQELVQMLGKPQNLVSYHLNQLNQVQWVRERRSSADRRVIYYSLDIDQLRSSFLTSGEALHPSLIVEQRTILERDDLPSKRALFLCTHNSARSQMAEGILHWRSQGKIQVFSAGTEPGQVHPLAVQVLAEMGIDIRDHWSKHLNEFLDQEFDYIITVCDRARENCPVFPGAPHMIHWSFADPAEVSGPDDKKYLAFKETAIQLNTRIGYLLLFLHKNGSK